MAAPLAEKGVELERTLGYFQFNRDCDDEEVRMLILSKWADDPEGYSGGGYGWTFTESFLAAPVLFCHVQRVSLACSSLILATPFAD